MTNLARLRRTLNLATDLNSIVGTMKTLAAVNSRHFESAARAIDEYVATIELGLVVALRELHPASAEPPAQVARLVIGSDQGMCGAFNERLASRAADELREADGPLVVVGHRVARRLEADGWTIDEEFRSPGSSDGVTDLVRELLVLFGDWQDVEAIGGVDVVSASPRPEGGFEVKLRRLLPMDEAWLAELVERPWTSRSLPTHPHDGERLFRWLVREWLFAGLYQACAASLAAENTARLLATQAAQRALEERVVELRTRYRNQRQQAITEELLDLHR